jgi:hypothetical protein
VSAWVFAATFACAARAAAPAAPPPYGVLILAYDVNVKWRQELGNLRGQLKGHAVESVDSAGDAISVQRAVDRLLAQRVGKIVAVPLDTISKSVRMDQTRFMFGLRANPSLDVPGTQSGNLADRPRAKLKAPTKSLLVLPKDQDRGLALPVAGAGSTQKQIRSSVPLVLAPTLDLSPVLVDILADRAKALAKIPARENLVLAGIGPRSDAALKEWKAAAQAIAEKVGAKAGFRSAAAVAVRDGVRADQQDADRSALQKQFRSMLHDGAVVVVPLSPESERVDGLLRKQLGGFFAYRWNGQGIQGDRRLLGWIKSSAEAAAAQPDGREFKDAAPRAAQGGRR